MMNICKKYYKDYFSIGPDIGSTKKIVYTNIKHGDNKDVIEVRNNKIIEHRNISNIYNCSNLEQSFRMKVDYPGLITGIGINHEMGIEGEFKLGMHFDYTTGMPIVYGSSVKGVLSDYFLEFFDEWAESIGFNKDSINKNALLFDIFGENAKHDNTKYTSKSIYKRDIFFDAVIVEANSNGRILDKDSITPHNENPLKNPTPLTFLKIASGCTIEFRLKLHNSVIESVEFTTVNKISLFKYILSEVGIGAKTNVGYGQLSEL
ncbi:MAG: type III-B CRISPR module RAMP protein Cmr6 [Rikenellaceae bacterium]